MKKKEKIKGTIISYISIALQFAINLFFVPQLIRALGNDEYGLYETINSLGSSLAFINFGIASIMARNIVKYSNENDKNKLENFLAICTIISAIISVSIMALGGVLVFFVEPMYENSLTEYQLIKAKYILIYVVINLALSSWHNYNNGLISGYERFSFIGLMKIFRQVVRIILLSILIMIGIDSIIVVKTDLLVTIILLITEFLYCKIKLKVKVKYHYMDKLLFKEVLLFSLASMIQTITNQINLSLDKVILGATMTTEIVALYSVGLLVVNVTVSILQIINSVYLPDATRLVLKNSSGTEMTNFVIRPDRVQCVIGCGIVFGFLAIGKQFLAYWMGERFQEIWLSTVILLVFATLSYVTSVANVILDAMLKKMSRSLILIGTALINIIITLILVKPLGYLGAAIGTALSMLLGNIILLNIYFKKKIGLEISRMYKEIFKGILPSAALAFLFTTTIKLILPDSMIIIIVPAISFVFIYFANLYIFGLNIKEKETIANILTKIKRKFFGK